MMDIMDMNENNSAYICILCPRGCALQAVRAADGSIFVRGNYCARGQSYAEEEMTRPARIVTTTIPLSGADRLRLPVRTERPVPKTRIFVVLEEIRRYTRKNTIPLPVKAGDVLIRNIADTGTAVIAASAAFASEETAFS